MDWILNFTRQGTKDKKLMPQQARNLLDLELWGIPASAQAKEKLEPDDRVLVYVGAPDKVFIGDARLAIGWHHWTAVEAQAYGTAGSFAAGVSLVDCRCWNKPVSLNAIWPETKGAKTNPKARWYGAVARLAADDFDLILSAGVNTAGAVSVSPSSTVPVAETGADAPDAPLTPVTAETSGPLSGFAVAPQSGHSESDALFAVAVKLRQYLQAPKPMSEDGTRAFFIDKWLDALGYSGFDEIEHNVKIASGDFADYVLAAQGKRVMLVEAKAIGHEMGAKESAQIVKYGSVLSLRWGLLTDGRYVHAYDMPVTVTGVAPEDRVILSIDLADFVDREDFDTRIWPAASILSKAAMATGAELEHHAAREQVRTLLSTENSGVIEALLKDLQKRKFFLSPLEIVALLQDMIG